MKINQIYNPQEITDLAKLRFQEERAQDYLTGWFLAREIAMECDDKFKNQLCDSLFNMQKNITK